MADTFAWCALADTTGATTLRARVAQFGDGYSQAAADGINNRVDNWPLVFRGTGATIAAIQNFLDAHGGHTAFNYKPPLRPAGLYRCAAYTTQAQGADVFTLAATFVQVFAP